VEYLSHRLTRGGGGTTMDSMCGPQIPAKTKPEIPIAAKAHSEGGQA